VSLGATLPDVGGARLVNTACYYVSRDGDEQSTTFRDVRLDAVADGLPVRPIHSFAGERHYPGVFWSVTTGDHVWYESLLEHDRLLLADYDPDVVGIAAQPMWLVGKDNGDARRHVPDLLLALSNGNFIWSTSNRPNSPNMVDHRMVIESGNFTASVRHPPPARTR